MANKPLKYSSFYLWQMGISGVISNSLLLLFFLFLLFVVFFNLGLALYFNNYFCLLSPDENKVGATLNDL